ncbi:MAG TPA: multiple cyclophane-containing RiPP AmcA [Pilimelia sp.]|nr:multiple cyclophane-containing RiPP AmcA [Pilimelia sp.]
MPEPTSQRSPEGDEDLADRVHGARAALTALLAEAGIARQRRSEAADEGSGAVCAWNHFENIPTFYNWNNRPR